MVWILIRFLLYIQSYMFYWKYALKNFGRIKVQVDYIFIYQSVLKSYTEALLISGNSQNLFGIRIFSSEIYLFSRKQLAVFSWCHLRKSTFYAYILLRETFLLKLKLI